MAACVESSYLVFEDFAFNLTSSSNLLRRMASVNLPSKKNKFSMLRLDNACYERADRWIASSKQQAASSKQKKV
eukprot:scaffold8594_cov81-Skeletonema_dohrnii-CCMP3373.AAC.4